MDERIRSASKYNLWYNNTIDSGFQRQIYTKDIDKYLGSKVVKVLTDEQTIEREYTPLEIITDNYEKIVVSLDDFQLPSRNGIRHIRAWELSRILL